MLLSREQFVERLRMNPGSTAAEYEYVDGEKEVHIYKWDFEEDCLLDVQAGVHILPEDLIEDELYPF